MIERLGAKQRRFARSSVLLLSRMIDDGYEFTYGETFRTDEQAEINAIGHIRREQLSAMIQGEFPELARRILNNGKNKGIRESVHQLKLAIDVNLFLNGVYLMDTEHHRGYGTWWKSLGADYRWGGDWGDGNHYSIEHNGVK